MIEYKCICNYCNTSIIKKCKPKNRNFCNLDCLHLFFRGKNHSNFGKPNPLARLRLNNLHILQKQKFLLVNIFSSWTPESLWVTGMLASDGWLYNSKDHKGIGFSGDYGDLLKIKSIFDSKQKIRKAKGSKSYVMNLSNPLLFDATYKIGLFPNKSLTMGYPKIPKGYEFTRHFIRGVFDGDGCVYLAKDNRRKKHYLNSKISSGSKLFLEQLQTEILKYNIYSKLIKNQHKNNIWYELYFSTSNSIKLYRMFYEDIPTHIFSSRRKERFEYCINENNHSYEVIV